MLNSMAAQSVQHVTHHKTKDGISFAMRHLLQSDYEKLRSLHDAVHRDLEEKGHQSFFLHKSEEQLRDCLNYDSATPGKLGVTIGACIGDRLIGVSSITFPKERNDVALVVMPDLPIEQISEFRSSAVHPEFQGHNINQAIFRYQVGVVSNTNRHPVSEFEVHNIASWKTSVRMGMHIEYTGVDPDDGAKLIYGVLRTGAPLNERDETVIHPANEWNVFQQSLMDGYRGITVTETGALVCQRAL